MIKVLVALSIGSLIGFFTAALLSASKENNSTKRGESMNYIGDAIEYLKNYENLKKAIDNLENDIKELKAELNAGQVKGIEYSDMPKGDSPGLPDDNIINKMYMLQIKRKEYAITKKTIEKMDKVLSGLSKEDERILRAWYIDGLRGDTVYKHTLCSERNFYRCKSNALKNFAVQLHGIRAI